MLWLPALGGLVVFLLLQTLYWNARALKDARRARFLARMWGPEAEDVAEASLFKPTRLSHRRSLQKFLGGHPLAHELARQIEMAGLQNLTVSRLLAQAMGAFVVGTVAAVGVFELGVLLGITYGVLAAAFPFLYVSHCRSKRAAAFEKQLPQGLELLSLTLRAGRSLPQAFETLAAELLPPSNEEFGLVCEEYRLGRPLLISLRNVGEKYPSCAGYRSLLVAVSVLGQTGGNLVDVIERIRKTLEMSSQYELRLKALTGETRMTAVILGALPGVFLGFSMVTGTLSIEQMLGSPIGLVMFGGSLTLWVGGILWLRALLNAKPL